MWFGPAEVPACVLVGNNNTRSLLLIDGFTFYLYILPHTSFKVLSLDVYVSFFYAVVDVVSNCDRFVFD